MSKYTLVPELLDMMEGVWLKCLMDGLNDKEDGEYRGLVYSWRREDFKEDEKRAEGGGANGRRGTEGRLR